MGDETILTAAECTEVLTALLKSEFQIINYSIKPISDTAQGYSAQHFRAVCNINVNGETKTVKFFIKKRIELADGKFSGFNDQIDLFRTEATILKILNDGNENATWLPKLLKYKSPNLVILEDLGERQYQLAKVKPGLFDLEHCKGILRALAHLHAFSFNYDRENSISILDRPNIFFDTLTTDNKDMLNESVVTTGIEATIFLINETPQKCLKDQIIKNLRAYSKEYIDGFQSKKSKFATISHGDLWANNFMFKYNTDNPIDCCLIDFQVIRYVPFTQDVLVSIFINTNKEFRLKHLDELVDYYYEAFCTVLSSIYGIIPEDIITKDEYYELVEERKKSAIITSIWYKHFLLMDPEVMSESLVGDNLLESVFGDRVPFMKPQLDSDEKYRTAIFKELEDLIDAFL